MSGILHVVATPIGNLGDLSDRARDVLGSADVIAAEDTRHTGRLLAHLGLDRPLLSFHDHSGERRIDQIIARLREGQTVALVSDAGTPLISDPGYELVKQARELGIEVIPVPGPSSVMAVLSVAGLPTDRFSFHGFPPSRPGARDAMLQELAAVPGTLVLMESARRIGPLVDSMMAIFGQDRAAFIGREMTKRHEQYVPGTLVELARALASGAIPAKGEFVLAVAGASNPATADAETRALELLAVLVEELPVSRAAKVAARLTDVPRQRCYQLAEGLREG